MYEGMMVGTMDDLAAGTGDEQGSLQLWGSPRTSNYWRVMPLPDPQHRPRLTVKCSDSASLLSEWKPFQIKIHQIPRDSRWALFSLTHLLAPFPSVWEGSLFQSLP